MLVHHQSRIDAQSALQERKRVRMEQRELTAKEREARLTKAHQTSIHGHLDVNNKWVESNLRKEATTKEGKQYTTSKKPIERVLDMILEEKGVTLDAFDKPCKDSQLDDGTFTLSLNKLMLGALVTNGNSLDSTGQLISLTDLPGFLQLRLEPGWRVIGASNMQKSDKRDARNLMHSYNSTDDRGCFDVFINARLKSFSKSYSAVEFVDVVWLKSCFPNVIRGFCRSYNNVSPNESIEVSDHVRKFVLDLFNSHSTMNAAMMRLRVVEEFPLAIDQIPESTISGLISRFSRQRKTGEDLGNQTNITATCTLNLEAQPELKTDVKNLTALRKLNKDSLRAYLFYRNVALDITTHPIQLCSLESLSKVTTTKRECTSSHVYFRYKK
jgi:hypothetical protein